MKNKIMTAVAVVAATSMLGACASVGSDERGVVIKRGKVTKCVNPGWTSENLSFGSDVKTMPVGLDRTDMSASPTEGDRKGIDDSVPVVSKEGVRINYDITVSYLISSDCEKIKTAYINRIRSANDVRERIVRVSVRSGLRDIVGKLDAKSATNSSRQQIQHELEALLTEKFAAAPSNGLVSLQSVDLRNSVVEESFKKRLDDLVQADFARQQALINGDKELKQVEFNSQKQLREAEANRKAQAATNQLWIEKAEANKKIQQADGEAEAAKIIAKAKAEAEANKIIGESLTDNLAKHREALAQAEALAKAGTVIVGGGSNSAAPNIILDGRK